MLEPLAILFGSAFTVASCWGLGELLLRVLRLRLRPQERGLVSFVAGAACLSLTIFATAALGLVRPAVFLALGLTAIGAGLWHRRRYPPLKPLPRIPRFWLALLVAGYAAFTWIYFLHAMAPEYSADGSRYHLGWVLRYFYAHGFFRVTTDMYATLSQGAELLYLFAFAFGRHSAAVLVHFAFLIALPWAMVCYARRFGFPAAGVLGGLLVFFSPIVGWDGSTAYVDVVVACVAFVMFYLLRIWAAEGTPALLVPIGLLAGFCYAIKYTAGVAVPFALAAVAWRMFRKRERPLAPLAVVSLCAVLMIAPWLVKNWVWVGNPVAPFFNSLFPNPYFHISQEQSYREGLAHFNEIRDPRQIALEVTVRGQKLGGLLGPVFLLAPLALLALRRREGAPLLIAACVFALPYPANIGTRFLIPMLPFLALAMAMAIAWPRLAAATLVLAHGLLSWPSLITTYSAPYALRILDVSAGAAFRRESEEHYLRRRMGEYQAARMLDEYVPPQARVFTFSAPPLAYTRRTVLVYYQAALNNICQDLLWVPLIDVFKPTRRVTFEFPPARVRGLRVTLVAATPNRHWGLTEVHVLSGGRELRGPWRLSAKPNPWEAPLAFDGSLATRWRTWQEAAAGMYLEADFPRPEAIDQATLESAEWDSQPRLRLDGLAETGWVALSDRPRESVVAAPPDLRRLGTAEIKRRGVDYVLLREHDFMAADVASNPAAWGLLLAAQYQDWRLYRIE